MKFKVFFIMTFLSFFAHAQNHTSRAKIKQIILVKDTVYLEKFSISPFNFKILNKNGITVLNTDYKINYAKAMLVISAKKYSKISVYYDLLPDFLTKTYKMFDTSLIVPNSSDLTKAYRLTQAKKETVFQPFEGLNSSGSISRSINLGSNQNTGLRSNFDLQISGKISKNIGLRASISDDNVALQEGSFTQRLNEFDRVFIELYSQNWRVRAGDIDLHNNETQFLRFTKKVSGLAINAAIKPNKITTMASGAVVKGRFYQFKFNGQEGNQGPYRIKGPNGQEFVLIIAGSETVFVNGLPIKRGENSDYVLDYRSAQITFNATFPVTANMRIVVEYQFTDRNYTRFISYENFKYKAKNLSIDTYFYNENDAKNQPVQLNLTPDQQLILAQSGDTQTDMVVPSAVATAFDVNKILYRKQVVDNREIFEFSTNPLETLFSVSFSFIGTNQGDYILKQSATNGRIFEYITPVNGTKQGEYSPVVQLIAPEKLQVAVINTAFSPNAKSKISAEVALSNYDKNLFSSLQDNDNKGIATKIGYKQILLDKTWRLSTDLNYEYNSENFKSVERFQSVEFTRDWNLEQTNGVQNILRIGANLQHKNTKLLYAFQYLSFGGDFTGNKHVLSGTYKRKNFMTYFNTRYLQSESTLQKGSFFRLQANTTKQFSKTWAGASLNVESNKQNAKISNNLLAVSQEYKDITAFWGIGDSTKVFVKLGINYRKNDSVYHSKLQQVSKSSTYFIDSKIIQKKSANLSLFANYRTVNNLFRTDDVSLNSRVIYTQKLFDNKVRLRTVYETQSGSLAQQEFTYVAVDDGQGFYTWIDYNENGIQELNEFEIAVFKDQANFVRLFLPNVSFLKTHLNKFSQSVVINPNVWQTKTGFKKWASHFINQTFLLIENNKLRTGNSFNLNPFDVANKSVVGLQFSLRNSLFFNRGKQHYSTTYIYTNAKNISNLITGSQESLNKIHQVLFTHKLSKFWLLDIDSQFGKNSNTTESFANRNYVLESYKFAPKVTFLFNLKTSFELKYIFESIKNKVLQFEALQAHNFGITLLYNNKQNLSVQSGADLFINNFKGNSNSPVAFQMLKGLQPGNNFTWHVIMQKRLSNFLDFNLSYFGRKSENTKIIHTGSVQLRANF
ncbi:MAG: hypothetical protein L3J45_03545 [Flavobacteriaceae bacterium]|nr:hypothetical protein [Flavobacteriaceae bacterium]